MVKNLKHTLEDKSVALKIIVKELLEVIQHMQ